MALLILAALLPPLARAQEADRLKAIEERLNKLEGAPANASLSSFNPSLGVLLDVNYTHGKDDKGTFNFKTAELNIGAPIDPFLKGWAVINFNPAGVEVEEASLKTTSLPYNLTLTGGRLFASFGRLAHFHDDSLPVTKRPRSLENFVGGETQADGLEVQHLFPTPFYLTATLGAYNKLGGENGRADNAVARPLDHFTYLGRLATYADLGADHSLELGINSAWTPKRTMVEDVSVTGSPAPAISTVKGTWRTLSGVDLTYRYHPAQGGIYKGLVWATEVMQNNERRFDPGTRLPVDRVRAYAGLSAIEFKLGRQWRPGVLVDLTEDLDNPHTLTRTYTGFLSWWPSEFQRLRLSYSKATNNVPGSRENHSVALQWTGALGFHVHGFKDR